MRDPATHLVLSRRRLLHGSALLGGVGLMGLGGCASEPEEPALAPLHAEMDRLTRITVCLRPFRAAGPRRDAERVGDKLVIHNYGHGGSGWSLSWGSGMRAVRQAMAESPSSIAVIGSGALGLTAATLAQRAGARVTIYARELLPQARSARATGLWTPDSRIALTDGVAPDFPALWEEMARAAFAMHQSYLGRPGEPVAWTDRYILSDGTAGGGGGAGDGFATYYDRIRDLLPHSETLDPARTQFPTASVRRYRTLMFNIAAYGRTLTEDFVAGGGTIAPADFHAPGELAALSEPVVIDCTGYDARALWQDQSITPVRGQIGWLAPQPELTYGVLYHGVSTVARRDGIVVQAVDGGDLKGFGDSNEMPDRAETEQAVATLAQLYAGFRVRSVLDWRSIRMRQAS